ncbi:MAG: pyridoxal-phosphate dependent enzyme [Acidobacteria bacterium]|nr:pyridoxal-phosphate dependent enzyme [Acidobacteriota bacterium]MBI3655379.1 pyridoxal-phosphate dependent enzyme [Acidobacteriota bacterium]
MLYESILDTIGNTPLVRLNKLTRGVKCKVYAKLEYFNPGGSVKDRIAVTMVQGAEGRGELGPSGTIVECTSGNTGMGLAILSCVKNYRAIFTLNDKQSREKISALKAMGAEVIVCPTAVTPEDPRHYVEVARHLHKEIAGSFWPNQYDNPDNWRAHYGTTGPEIWRDTDGKITHFVCGMGTCGTIVGTGKYLKEKNPKIKVIGVDPQGSIFYDYFHRRHIPEAHVYKVEGIGEDFFPKVLDWTFIDDMVRVSDKECFVTVRKLARQEGIFAGGSAGGAVHGALHVAQSLDENALVVCLLPDGGMRYLGKIFNDEWMRENQLIETEIRLNCYDILKAKKIKRLIFAEPGETAMSALKKMRSGDISQLPVIESGQVIGTLHEDDLVTNVLLGKDLNSFIVRELMKGPLPVLSKEATLEEITGYIPGKSPAVLVDLDDGNFDVITKYDLVSTVGQFAEGKL